MSAVHWANRCRGAKDPMSKALMRMLGVLEMRNEWRFRAEDIKGIAQTLADGISRWKRDESGSNLQASRPDVCWQEEQLGQEALDIRSAVLDSSSLDDQSRRRLKMCLRCSNRTQAPSGSCLSSFLCASSCQRE